MSDTSGEQQQTSWAAKPLVTLLWLYQRVLSPLTPPTCRFTPSCSAYAVTALQRHGLLRGGILTVRRLLRCHPWNPGGVDHVPPPSPDRRSDHSRPTDPSTGSTPA